MVGEKSLNGVNGGGGGTGLGGRGGKLENLKIGFPSTGGAVDRTSIMFTLKNQVGCLAKALQVFQELGINVLHLDLQNSDQNKVKREGDEKK